MKTKTYTPRQVKKLLIIYYILTGLLVLDVMMTGLAFLAASFTSVPQITDTLIRLGYPIYLLPILALIKIGGGLALLIRSKFREWAHVGFFFMFLLAFYSHLSAGDGFANSFPALLAFMLNLAAYFVFKALFSANYPRMSL